MSNDAKKRPCSFVLMPYGEGFDEIYNLFIHETLAAAGYTVQRAGDIKSSQNILKDIVTGIWLADLIVADLTDSNANVYYELGLAHAMRKPVILLTQSIEELPFDLRSYRVISYKTHFAEVDRAKRQLTDLALGFLKGTVEFGSPVSDFLPADTPRAQPRLPQQDGEGQPGFLDYRVAFEEGFQELTSLAADWTTRTTAMSKKSVLLTQTIETLATRPGPGSTRELRTAVMNHARELTDYASHLASENESYSKTLSRIGDALESIVRLHDVHSEDERAKLREFLAALNLAQDQSRVALKSVRSLTETYRNSPRPERQYNRSIESVVRELDRFIENIERTQSIFSRAQELGSLRLKDG